MIAHKPNLAFLALTCPSNRTTSTFTRTTLPTSLPAVHCTMASTYSEYSIDAEIASFFSKTSATRSACDARAKELAGGNVVPVKVQGACSYSVYAGVDLEYVVQFRLKSLDLRAETTTLARNVYGSLVPEVAF